MAEKTIKAIETEYNGYKFRSRLEARWAVFFDNARIEYEYEPEGYENELGERYLPDFYLPQFDAHVEVKRNTKEGFDEVDRKCGGAIRWGGPIKQIIILSDVPEGKSNDGGIWHFPVIFWMADGVSWGWWFFFDGDNDSNLVWGKISSADYPNVSFWKDKENSIGAVSDYRLRRYCNYLWDRHEKLKEIENLLGCGIEGLSLEQHIELQMKQNALTFKSFEIARKARFEFGETPKRKKES